MAAAHPTVLVALGDIGQRVLDRLLGALDGAEPMLATVPHTGEPVAPRLASALDPLLRVGRESGSAKLDIFVFAAALQGEDDALASLVRDCSALIQQRYSVLFPPDRPPEQRAAALHLVVLCPPLAPTQPGRRALARLALVQEAATQAIHPLLARVWVISQQTLAGTLTVEDSLATASGFALASLASGLREDESLRERLAHPSRGEGIFGFLSVASLDLPEARLRRYADLRARWDGLRTLIGRVEKPVEDPSAALGLVSTLRPEAWSSALVAPPVEPAAAPILVIGAFDRPQTVREALVQASPRQVAAAALDLDRAEAGAVREAEQGVRRLIERHLGPGSGLRALPDLAYGLKQVLSQLPELGDAPAPVVQTRAAPDIEAALAAIPSTSATLRAASALGLVVGLIVVVLALPSAPAMTGLSAPTLSAASAAPAQSGLAWAELLPWGLGLAVGALATVLWAWRLSDRARAPLREAIETLRVSHTQARVDLTQMRADHTRARRLRRDTSAFVAQGLARLDAIRTSLSESRDLARQALLVLGVDPGPDASAEDLRPLLTESGPLHGWLLPASALPRMVVRGRRLADPEVWADRLLERGWPDGGLLADVPCADEASLDAAAREQTEPLARLSPFEDPDLAAAAASATAGFLRRAATALAPPCQPKDAHDRPVLGPGPILAVGPMLGRDALLPALKASPVGITALWSPSPAARLLLLRTWEGLDLADIARGSGVESP